MRRQLRVIEQCMDEVVIESICPRCGKAQNLSVPLEGFKAWQNGQLIQRALPTLSSDQREALISGFCQQCGDDMFAEES